MNPNQASMESELHTCVQRLYEAEVRRVPIKPLTDSYSITESRAYDIQDALLALKGEPIAGYKLGFTSRAMREQMGIRSPNYGRLTQSMGLEKSYVKWSRLIHPRVEPEIVVVVERSLKGPGLPLHVVQRAIRWVYPALEIVDSRYQDYRFQLEDNTADNSSAARYVLGTPRLMDGHDLRLVSVLLQKNGRTLESGIGANAMGDPLQAVTWLINRLGELGRDIEEGSLILTGGLTRAYPAERGETFYAEFGTLGHVLVHFDADE